MTELASPAPLVTHRGGCHCGAVRFEFQAPARVIAHRCNCSICSMTGYLHLIVPAARFRLLTDAAVFGRYRFNSGVAEHLFCSRCGIKSFYVPRSNPDGYSIHLGCVERASFEQVVIEDFDGRNWEQHAAGLAHLSRPSP
jgi:hypothetical protein